MISDTHKFIFVHIDKTGGTSIEKAFEPDADQHDGHHKHEPVAFYKQMFPDQFRTYFKFAFVRNPWDWLVSRYHWSKARQRSFDYSFDEFLWRLKKLIRLSERVLWLEDMALKPQLDLLTLGGDIAVDFVGRFENLQSDFDLVCSRLRIEPKTLQHVFKTNHAHYSDYYSDENRRIVEQLYAADIATFGYRFEDAPRPTRASEERHVAIASNPDLRRLSWMPATWPRTLMQDPQPKLWPLHHQTNTDLNVSPSISKFHQGINYDQYLQRIHQVWKPSSYLEIGVDSGATLAFAQCPTVAIDPNFQLRRDPIGQRVETYLFQMKSDDFFARYDLRRFLPDGVDFGFLDGMHHFEYLLRDFLNAEKYSHKDSIVALHDCYPVNTEMTNREARRIWWAGDVWKLLPILRDFRPDLAVTILDCPPTGLVIVQGLDSNSKVLIDSFDEIVAKYRDINLDEFGIERFRKEFLTTDSRRVFQPEALRNFLTHQT